MLRQKKRRQADFAPIDNGDGTSRVPLCSPTGREVFALIDTVDVHRVSFIAWQHRIEPAGQEYAMGCYRSSGRTISTRMHRLLLCYPHFQIDHIDGNGLNNRRSNLRFCDNRQNQWNCKKNKSGKYSHYKGVTFHTATGLWKSQLQKDRKQVHAKYHRDPLSAALAYDEAALLHFGEFAATNKKLGLLDIPHAEFDKSQYSHLITRNVIRTARLLEQAQ